jgi:thymidylate kinase
MISIYPDIFSKDAHSIKVDEALNRIKNGRSKDKVLQIRNTTNKDEANKLKCKLPSVCFSGEFKERTDAGLIKHSGVICLDFDDVEDVELKKIELKQYQFIYATWISPSGKGVKALVNIAKPDKHREHFQAIQDIFPEIDRSGINVSRVCYESYDPEIIINPNATVFTKIKEVTQEIEKQKVNDTYEVFKKILVWLSNKGEVYSEGGRNLFFFKLASACCRFGLMEHEAYQNCANEYLSKDSTFTSIELMRVVKSAYRSNGKDFGSAAFELDILVNKVTKSEVNLNEASLISDLNQEQEWLTLARKNKIPQGYDIGSSEFDAHYRLKPRTMVGVFGIDNVGKTTFHNFLAVCYSKRHKVNWLFICRENENASIRQNIIELYNGKPLHEQTEHEYQEALKFSYDYFDILDNKFDLDMGNFFEVLEKVYSKKHYFATFIDPYNAVQFEQTPKKNYEFLKKLRDFQNEKDTSFHISMHISTEKARNFVYGDKEFMNNFMGEAISLGGHLKVPRKNFVEGGQPIANKLDDIIIVHRIAKCEGLRHYTLVAVDKVKEYKTGGMPTTDMPIKFKKQFNFLSFIDSDKINPLSLNEQTQAIKPNVDFGLSKEDVESVYGDINNTTTLDEAPF